MPVVETTTFRLAGGADEEAFLAADGRVQTEFAYRQPGIVRRTTARGAGGEWLVVTLWGSEDEAVAAAGAAERDPAVAALLEHVDAATLRTARYATVD